jgi:hypothetical protein
MVTTTQVVAEVEEAVTTKLNGQVVQVVVVLVLGHLMVEEHRVKKEDKPLPVPHVVEVAEAARVQDIYKEDKRVVLVL